MRAVGSVVTFAGFLAVYGVAASLLCFVGVFAEPRIAVYAILGTNFFMSIMFPTIFALGVKDLGEQTKLGSSFIIMSIVGGALVPYVMGYLAQAYSTPFSYIVPMICFAVVLLFAVVGYKIKAN